MAYATAGRMRGPRFRGEMRGSGGEAWLGHDHSRPLVAVCFGLSTWAYWRERRQGARVSPEAAQRRDRP